MEKTLSEGEITNPKEPRHQSQEVWSPVPSMSLGSLPAEGKLGTRTQITITDHCVVSELK